MSTPTDQIPVEINLDQEPGPDGTPWVVMYVIVGTVAVKVVIPPDFAVGLGENLSVVGKQLGTDVPKSQKSRLAVPDGATVEAVNRRKFH
jgi:hypothetical protein